MKTIEQRFTVTYQYPVIFQRDIFAPDCNVLEDVLARDPEATTPHRVLIFIDRGVEQKHPTLAKRITDWLIARQEHIVLAAPIEHLPGNEFVKKHDAIAEKIVKIAYQAHIGRKDFFIAIGGGAVQDVVGYAAGILHRGTHMIRINTTTLSQADAGVGVKNGVDYGSCKNFLGTFAPPFAVINDATFLPTLSDKDWRNGIAEAVKVAAIKDASFFAWLREHADGLRMRDLDTMEAMIERSAALHLAHICGGGDPFEHGSARPLDFGHWSAHRLEAMSCYQISHGEGVAVGVALDSVYASMLGLISPVDCSRIIGLLRDCGLHVWSDELTLRGTDGHLAILEGLRQFREHLGGRLNVTLPDGIGSKVEVHEMDEDILERAIRQLRERFA